MAEFIEAPWTDEQVTELNKYQAAGKMHPFTCGRRSFAGHEQIDPEGDYGVLVATNVGWVCRHCDYTQTWAHSFMADPTAGWDGLDLFRIDR